MNHFGHIDLRVRDITVALTFYSQVLPALGFTRTFHSPQWKVFAADGDFPEVAYFALTEDPQHQSNASRIAFWVESRQEVDRLGGVARMAGAQNIEGPDSCPEISPSYYAVFFADPSGNRLEIYNRLN